MRMLLQAGTRHLDSRSLDNSVCGPLILLSFMVPSFAPSFFLLPFFSRFSSSATPFPMVAQFFFFAFVCFLAFAIDVGVQLPSPLSSTRQQRRRKGSQRFIKLFTPANLQAQVHAQPVLRSVQHCGL